MRITERKLRRVISNVINEMSDVLPPVSDDLIKRMADVCCMMSSARLFEMCAKICAGNADQARHCAELCACACRGDEQGCCQCLSEICKCDHCAEVCAQYCGC